MKVFKFVIIFLFSCATNCIYAQVGVTYMSQTGTINPYPKTITSADPTSLEELSQTPTEEENVRMYDREAASGAGDWIYVDAYVFDVKYDDDLTAQVRLRKSDYSAGEGASQEEIKEAKEAAREDALTYATMMGQLPRCLRGAVEHINLMKGDGVWGGNSGTKALDIQLGSVSQGYARDGILEETLVHEACHAFFPDTQHSSEGWATAQEEDPLSISEYAADYPQREDFAESFVPYVALNYRRSRITDAQAKSIREAIPHRMKYMEDAKYKMYPLTIKDIDGNEYKINEIGDQTWMTENLKVTKCNDGQALQVLDIGASASSPAMYWHDNSSESANSEKYGPLYNWSAVKDCNVCPTGWHVPNQEEWNLLLRHWYNKTLDNGSTVVAGAAGLTYAAYQLREVGDDYWSNNEKATNSAGFSARPGGWLSNGTFQYLGSRNGWWVSNRNKKVSLMTKIADQDNGIWTSKASTKDAVYIRCLKDN